MALTQLMAFVNAGILIISFALLLIVLSFNVSQINSVAVFANAKSVASALGTRFITSPNCFAYKLNMEYYNNNSDVQGGPLYSASDTEPDVIDSSKFVASNFLSCAQYIYFAGATQVPVLTTGLAAITGISLTLVDTQNPSNLGPTGSVTINNYNQLNFGSKFYALQNAIQSFATNAEYVAMGVSIAASIAVQIATGGSVNFNLILAIGSNNKDSVLPQYAAISLLGSETTYTQTFPVTIEYTNSQDQPLYQDSGTLYETITYGLSPYA